MASSTNTNFPKVTVIMPTYNRANTLKTAIDSVLCQTYKNIELIVIDDASTDNTQSILKSISDSRFIYLTITKSHEGQDNRRANIARNKGLLRSAGVYISFQDSDDVWHSDKLEKQVNFFSKQSSDVGVVYSSFWRTTNNKRNLIPSKSQYPKDGDLRKALLYGNFIGGIMLLIRKECFDKVGLMDERFPKYQDWELLLRISEHYKFSYLDEPLAETYELKDSIAKVPRSKYIALKLLLEKFNNLFEREPKAYSRHLATLARLSLALDEGSTQEARTYSKQALSLNILNPNAYLAYALSLMGKRFFKCIKKCYKNG